MILTEILLKVVLKTYNPDRLMYEAIKNKGDHLLYMSFK